jgi:DeoR/GlpR family transcriptional regulator of sugar metabolism
VENVGSIKVAVKIVEKNKMNKSEQERNKDYLDRRMKVFSKFYQSYVLNSEENRMVALEYEDIEKIQKMDRRTFKSICRDIYNFCALVKLYGRGIQIDESTFYRSSIGKEIEVKEHIAQKLCDLFRGGSVRSIAFGPGSTAALCANILAEDDELPNTVVTNSLGVYDLLSGYQMINLILTGGEYKSSIHACVGSGAVDGFRSARCETSVMGLSAINKDGEMLVKYYYETDVLRQMLWSTTEKIFVVASIQKFVSRDTFPVISIKELLEKIPNVKVFIVTSPFSDLKDRDKREQAKEVADALMKIDSGQRVKIIGADDSEGE